MIRHEPRDKREPRPDADFSLSGLFGSGIKFWRDGPEWIRTPAILARKSARLHSKRSRNRSTRRSASGDLKSQISNFRLLRLSGLSNLKLKSQIFLSGYSAFHLTLRSAQPQSGSPIFFANSTTLFASVRRASRSTTSPMPVSDSTASFARLSAQIGHWSRGTGWNGGAGAGSGSGGRVLFPSPSSCSRQTPQVPTLGRPP